MDKDIWTEIDAIYKLPERQAGDIDSTQFGERYNIDQATAMRRMKKLVLLGEYKLETVKDITHPHGKRVIIRKIKL